MRSLLTQSAQLEDIRDIITLKPESSIWPLILWITAIPLLLALIGWLVLFLMKQAKIRAHEMAPETVATGSFTRLEAELDNMNPNAFGLEVSETLKNYLEAKFKDPIRYETAEEFLTRFANSSIPVTHLPTAIHQNLRTFVASSEEIKFGQPADAKEKMSPLLSLASTIVNLIETIDQSEKASDSII